MGEIPYFLANHCVILSPIKPSSKLRGDILIDTSVFPLFPGVMSQKPELPPHIFRMNERGLIEAIDIATGRILAVQSSEEDLLKNPRDRLTKITTPEGDMWIDRSLNFDMVGRLKAWPYSQLLGDLLCEAVTGGNPLSVACTSVGVPYSIVKRWERESPDFKLSLEQARRDGAEFNHGKILEIARTKGDAKTQIAALTWSAEKNDPDRYGNKTKLSGDASAPISFIISTGIDRRIPTGTHPAEEETQREVSEISVPERTPEEVTAVAEIGITTGVNRVEAVDE